MDSLRQKYDQENLYDVIADLPKQFLSAFSDTKISIDRNTKNIVFCGMGGSALPANLLKTLLSISKINFNILIKISRDYTLPYLVDKGWCGLFSSYSGNTEETLASLAEAEKLGMKQIIIIAHGGQLEEIALTKGYPFIKIPDFKQPRMSYGYYIAALLKIFSNSGLINLDFTPLEEDIAKTIAATKQIEIKAISLAKSLKGRIPIIYTSNIWKYVAMVWKINFNENSKTQCFWNVFPEMNHNEMVGFTNLIGNYKIMILRDPAENERTLERMAVFKDIMGEKIETEIIDMLDGSPFYKMLTILMLGLWTSYYLALEYGIDPTPVEMVEKFKKLMAE